MIWEKPLLWRRLTRILPDFPCTISGHIVFPKTQHTSVIRSKTIRIMLNSYNTLQYSTMLYHRSAYLGINTWCISARHYGHAGVLPSRPIYIFCVSYIGSDGPFLFFWGMTQVTSVIDFILSISAYSTDNSQGVCVSSYEHNWLYNDLFTLPADLIPFCLSSTGRRKICITALVSATVDSLLPWPNFLIKYKHNVRKTSWNILCGSGNTPYQT